MDNAIDETKAAADMVTASNNEDGIALALEKILGSRRCHCGRCDSCDIGGARLAAGAPICVGIHCLRADA